MMHDHEVSIPRVSGVQYHKLMRFARVIHSTAKSTREFKKEFRQALVKRATRDALAALHPCLEFLCLQLTIFTVREFGVRYKSQPLVHDLTNMSMVLLILEPHHDAVFGNVEKNVLDRYRTLNIVHQCPRIENLVEHFPECLGIMRKVVNAL